MRSRNKRTRAAGRGMRSRNKRTSVAGTSVAGTSVAGSGRRRTLKTRRRQRNLKGGTSPRYYTQGQIQGPPTRYAVAHSENLPEYEIPVKNLSIYKTPHLGPTPYKTPYEGEYATLRHKLRDNKDYRGITEWAPGAEYDPEND
jgi:hypothetical protein